MRIDEFSAPSNIDGTLSSTEQTGFLLFGFDIGLVDPTGIAATFVEYVSFDSLITLGVSFDSAITTAVNFDSKIGD